MTLIGLVILMLQIDSSEEKITKWALFLDSRIGRGFFYLFCGSIAGAGLVSRGNDWWLQMIGWLNLAACW